MRSTRCVVVALVCTLATATQAGEFFLDQSEFLARVDVLHTNTFDEITPGTMQEYTFDADPFVYSISSTDPNGQGLNNDTGYLRLADANEPMRFDFTNAPITAFGANFWAEDIAGSTDAGAYIIINISNGDQFIHSSTSETNFFSYASDQAFDSIEISYSAGDVGSPVFASVDNFSIAHPIPTPGVLSLFAMGTLATSRRTR